MNKVAFFTSQSQFWEIPEIASNQAVYFGEATDLPAIYRELKSSPEKFNLIILKGHRRNIRNDLFIRKISIEFGVQVSLLNR